MMMMEYRIKIQDRKKCPGKHFRSTIFGVNRKKPLIRYGPGKLFGRHLAELFAQIRLLVYANNFIEEKHSRKKINEQKEKSAFLPGKM